MNADLALRFVVGIAGVGAALSAAQDLASAAESSGTGLMSWTVISAVPKRRISDVIGRRVMPWSRYRWVLLAKLAFGVLAPFTAAGPRLGCALVATVLAASVMVTLLRSGYGLDGADQMSFIALVSGAAGMILGPDTAAANVVLAFLAAQLALSYLVAGIAKLVSAEWRNGIGLQGVFSTASYGNRRLADFAGSHPHWVRLVALATIAFECLFVFVFLAPTQVVLFVVIVGLSFHVMIAVTMRLNTFLFAFAAAYPALIFVTGGW
jgi:hypothetical protein